MTSNLRPDILAPSVEAEWRNEFVVELRLQGVSGRTIADALVEVEAHCNESGQSANDGFGPPVEYARALDLPDGSRWSRPQLVLTWVRLLLIVGAAWLISWGGASLALGREAEVGVGWLVSGAMTIAVMVLVFVLGERILRFVVNHLVWAAVGFAAVLAAIVAAGLPFKDVILGSVQALVPLGFGIAALAGWGVFTLVLKRRGQTLEDPLVPPLASTQQELDG